MFHKPFSSKRSNQGSPESVAAKERALESLVQSKVDLKVSEGNLVETDKIHRVIKAHNDANNYADWMEEIFLVRHSQKEAA